MERKVQLGLLQERAKDLQEAKSRVDGALQDEAALSSSQRRAAEEEGQQIAERLALTEHEIALCVAEQLKRRVAVRNAKANGSEHAANGNGSSSSSSSSSSAAQNRRPCSRRLRMAPGAHRTIALPSSSGCMNAQVMVSGTLPRMVGMCDCAAASRSNDCVSMRAQHASLR